MFHVTAEQRFSLYYAVLFGSIGAMHPFAALWMNHIGLSPAMIGVVVATPSLVMLLTTMAIGRWADALTDRRLAIITGNSIVLIAHLILFVITKEWVVWLVWLIVGVVMYAKVPITDAAALGLATRNGSDYARIRMFGSVGFLLTLTLAGFAYEYWGIGLFVGCLFLANVARLAAACFLPSMPRRGIQTASGLKPETSMSTSLYQTAVLMTLAAGALINASHAVVNTYGILLWTEQGLSESLASQAVGIGVLVEIGLMWWFKSLTRHLSARACLLIAAGCGMLRWSLLAVEPSIPLIFAAQVLHAVTFGMTFLACASFISRRVDEADAARGQGLLATLTTGCMASATFACGQLFDAWGSGLYWSMAGLCLLATVLIAGSYRFALAE